MTDADTISTSAALATSAGKVDMDQRAMDAGRVAAMEGPMSQDSRLDGRALALAAARAAGAFTPGVDDVDAVIERCIVVENLTEIVEKMTISDGGAPGPGALAEYVDAFFDADGNRVATVTGSALVARMVPHMWQHHRSRTEFADGSFETTGLVDATAVLHGVTQVLQLVGTSGRYAGKVGFMTLAISDPTQRPPHFAVSFALC